MTKRQRFYGFLEYVLAGMFIHGGINVFFTGDPATLPGFFAMLVGQYAVYVYGVMFFLTGALLLVGKWSKKTRLQKNMLLFMYLTCIYVFILATAISGINWGLTQTVVVGIVSASLWLRLKLKTEYITIEEFAKEYDTL